MDAIKNTAAQNIQPIKTNTAQNNQPAAENKVEMKKDGNKKLAAALMGLAALGTVGVVAYKVTHGKPVNVGIEDLKKAGVGYDEANKMMKNAQGLITDKDGNVIKDLVINAKKGPANIKIKDGQIVESTIAGTKKTPGCVKKFSVDNETGAKTVKIFDESGEKLEKSVSHVDLDGFKVTNFMNNDEKIVKSVQNIKTPDESCTLIMDNPLDLSKENIDKAKAILDIKNEAGNATRKILNGEEAHAHYNELFFS